MRTGFKKRNFVFKEIFFAIACACFFSFCSKKEKAGQQPDAVFEEVWNVMNERYALFSVKNINWDSVYSVYRARVNNTMSEQQLFKTISSMLETLKDGHVALLSPADTAVYDGFYTNYLRNFNYSNIIKNYLLNEFKSEGPVIYKISGQTGYLLCRSFANEISEAQLTTIFTALQNVTGLIIDVRGNLGGSLQNAQLLASRVINSKKLVKFELVKSGKGHNEFFNPQPYYLSPSFPSFNKKVVILTNRSCFSACNDFAVYISDNLNIQSVGDVTGGGGGIPNNYILKNGWILQYTATKTLSATGLPVEDGVKPDISISITPAQEAAGIDPVLEKALELVR
jgi:Peptidase family S41/Tricorn protease C1 domain